MSQDCCPQWLSTIINKKCMHKGLPIRLGLDRCGTVTYLKDILPSWSGQLSNKALSPWSRKTLGSLSWLNKRNKEISYMNARQLSSSNINKSYHNVYVSHGWWIHCVLIKGYNVCSSLLEKILPITISLQNMTRHRDKKNSSLQTCPW